MINPSLRCLRGELVVVGKQPDGDSIRFVPADGGGLKALRRSERIRPTRGDGSVQLRLEAIDTPETYYGALAQPLARPARDRLLELAGFGGIQRDGGGRGETVSRTVNAQLLQTAAPTSRWTRRWTPPRRRS